MYLYIHQQILYNILHLRHNMKFINLSSSHLGGSHWGSRARRSIPASAF